MTFGERLKGVLKKQGMTQRELAQKITVSESSFSKYTARDGMPRMSIVIKIADALGVSTDYLLRGRDRWIDPEKYLPITTDFVFVLINGRIGRMTYENAPTVAEYWPGEGWFLTDIKDNKGDFFEVVGWMPVPERRAE